MKKAVEIDWFSVAVSCMFHGKRSTIAKWQSHRIPRRQNSPHPRAHRQGKPRLNAVIDETEGTGSLRYALPKNLEAAITRLDDQQLDRLTSAVYEERTRRERLSLPGGQEQRRKAESPTKSLPQGKLNAVRAAFKAGVTPARIAREFGLSQADVRKALSGHGNKL